MMPQDQNQTRPASTRNRLACLFIFGTALLGCALILCGALLFVVAPGTSVLYLLASALTPSPQPNLARSTLTPARLSISAPTATRLPTLESAEAYVKRANDFYDKGDYDLAIADYKNSIYASPKRDPMVYNYLGLAYGMKGDFETAIIEFNTAIALEPNQVSALANRGWAHLRIKKYDQAIADTSHSIAINPKNPKVYNTRGSAYRNKGNEELAMADFDKAISINPNIPESYFYRGYGFELRFKYDDAIVDYTKAIELSPAYAEPYVHRGYCYRQQNQKPQAIADLEMYLRLNPNTTKRAQVEWWLSELR